MIDGINQNLPTKKYIFDQIADVESKFLQPLKASSKSFGEDIGLAGLDKRDKMIVQAISERKNTRWIEGKEAN